MGCKKSQKVLEGMDIAILIGLIVITIGIIALNVWFGKL
jgi:hypothetical protein